LLYQLSHIGGNALQRYIKKNKRPNFCFTFLFLLLMKVHILFLHSVITN